MWKIALSYWRQIQRRAPSPLFLDQTEARRAEKIFLDTEIDKLIREELDVFDPSDLEIWDKIGDYLRRGNSEYFAEIRMLQCYMAPSHTNAHTVRGRPTAKKEIRRFQNGLVREPKVNERKLLREWKTLCLSRRHQFVQSEDDTSYPEKRFAKGMCITFKSEGIWTIKEDCSKSNSKEKEVQSFVLCVDQPIDCQQEEEEHSYRRFLKVVIGIIILALLLVLFAKVGVLTLTFVLRVTVFHVIIYFAVLYMNYPQCGDCALSASLR